jgi:hypothetical protein
MTFEVDFFGDGIRDELLTQINLNRAAIGSFCRLFKLPRSLLIVKSLLS